MKRICMVLTGICFALTSLAQTDSTEKESDTIRIGNMVIIKDGKSTDDSDTDEVTIKRRRSYKPSNLSTNWWIVDLGISQIHDNTNYAQAIANGYLPAGANEDWFDLRNGKSI